MKAYEAREDARVDNFRARLETIWRVTESALNKAQRAVRTNVDGTVEDRSLAALPALLSQAHRNLELLGRATGELQDNARKVEQNVLNVLCIPRIRDSQSREAGPVVEVSATIEHLTKHQSSKMVWLEFSHNHAISGSTEPSQELTVWVQSRHEQFTFPVASGLSYREAARASWVQSR